jgi:hypothetical protein
LGKGYSVQEDNVALEYNIPPCKTRAGWVLAHKKMLEHLKGLLSKKGLAYSIDASAIFPKEEMVDPRAHIFGCDPDFNVWSLEPNPRPHCDNPFLRSCGGHVHIAFQGTNSSKILLGRKCDMFLGLWSVIKDPDTRRRQLYGKAGAIRFKPYGIEYRTLSNFWLADESKTGLIYDLVSIALNHPDSKVHNVQEIIDTGNVEKAANVLRNLGVGSLL